MEHLAQIYRILSFNQLVYSSIQILVQKYLAQYSWNINNVSAVEFWDSS